MLTLFPLGGTKECTHETNGLNVWILILQIWIAQNKRDLLAEICHFSLSKSRKIAFKFITKLFALLGKANVWILISYAARRIS